MSFVEDCPLKEKCIYPLSGYTVYTRLSSCWHELRSLVALVYVTDIVKYSDPLLKQ